MQSFRFSLSVSTFVLLLLQLSALVTAFDFYLTAGGDAPAHLRGHKVLVRNNEKEVIIGASGKVLMLRALRFDANSPTPKEDQLVELVWADKTDRQLAYDPQYRMMLQGRGRPYGELGFQMKEFRQKRWCQGPNHNLIRRYPSQANENCPGQKFKPFTLNIHYR